MKPQELKIAALNWVLAEQEKNNERRDEIAKSLNKIPYEDWQKARAIFPYNKRDPADQNYNFRNVARFFEKEHLNRVQMELTRELGSAKRLNLVFAVVGALLGFAAENAVKHSCRAPSWGSLERARFLVCEPRN